MASFKENLRNELDYQGLTVKELSAKTGIIKGTLDNYLGVRASIPPADIAVKIAKALNVSVEYLVTGKEASEKVENNNMAKEDKSLLKELKSIPKNMQTTIKTLIHQTSDNFNK